MAKKVQKGKPAKKAAQPAKKAAAKKPAQKAAPKKASKPVKKAAPKKAAKVVKKAAPKKPVKKAVAKPVKKAAAKKIIKKAAPKAVRPTGGKAAAKKPVKKVIAKKAAPKKPVKKAVVNKIVKKAVPQKAKPAAKTARPASAKVVQKPIVKAVAKVVKTVVKAVSKAISKPAVKAPEPKKTAAAPAKPVVAEKPVMQKPVPAPKKKSRDMDLDDDGRSSSRDEAPMIVEYKTPSIRRPQGPAPKPHINTDTRTRYSDSELKEFKELILKKLSEAQKDYELLKSTLSHKDDHGTDDTSPTFKLLEDGSDVLSKEETAHLASRQEKFIQNLQNALIRIENKTYGICRATGKLISKERLRSVPHATLAIEAKLEQNA
jgi:RNA polymerase-binding transcription factor DksA